MDKKAGGESASWALTPIIVDDERTWPEKLRVVFETNLEALAAYESERARIDAAAEAEVGLRVFPPTNPHAGTRARVLEKANDLLANAQVVGWHCARLHPDEITLIQSDGLRPLSRELAVNRVRKLEAAGEFSPKIADRLATENVADDPHRSGKVWLIFTRRPLCHEHGVLPLFRSWGGESLYLGQKSDSETGPILRGIGIPCIVEVVVPAMGITNCGSVGECVMRGFLDRRGVATGHSPEMEGYVRETIRNIRRVIRRDDPDFGGLTQCSTWGERI